MEQPGKVFFKWLYSPADFFEEKISVLLLGYDCLIENGTITVSLDLDEYQRYPNIQDHLHEIFNDYFKGANLTIQKPFTLTMAGVPISYPDGRKGYILQAEEGIYVTSFISADILVIDSSGNIRIDTKQERRYQTKRFGELAAKYRSSDPLLESLLSSSEKALNNPNTTLVYLFEIRDALQKRFGGEEAAQEAVGIDPGEWRNLGYLCNGKPLNQGRHGGQHVGALRDATEKELGEARDIAIKMVCAYMEYLEKGASKT